ncbi:T9SS type A sorting domain-containing protein [Neolewinella agarilytica]|uniref:T9SS type A sorting domain-containing protein n=1 Tax=Neolewinella agarilytica TaxID=478744 RepID=UPI0023561FF6|nr:T9SS type A sorting domain-containing protein [Neolewinella agarilytica]
MNTKRTHTLTAHKALLSFLFMIATATLFAQNEYAFYQPGVQYIYVNGEGYSDITTSPYAGIKVNNDTCNDLYTTADVRPRANSFEDYLQVPSFSGIEVCQYPDSIVMDIGKEFPVVIRKDLPPGTRWIATTEEGQTVFGVLDSVRYEEVGESFDSVRYINFYRGDTLLQDEPIKVSRSNGLLRGAYFWNLLNSRETLPLAPAGIRNPASSSFFDFSVGDELHIEEIETISESPITFRITQKIYRVLSVGPDLTAPRIEYSVSSLSYLKEAFYFSVPRFDSIFPPHDSLLLLNQIVTVNEHIPEWTKAQPGALTRGHKFGGSSVIGVRGGRKYQAYPLEDYGLYWMLGYWYDLDVGDTYIEKLGGPYYEFIGMHGQADIRRLNYFSLSNGSRSSGTPFDFEGSVSNANRQLLSLDLNVFPNPVIDKFRIDANDHSELEATIFNAKGLALKQVRIRSGADVDIADLPTGLYFLNVRSSSGVRVLKLVKK